MAGSHSLSAALLQLENFLQRLSFEIHLHTTQNKPRTHHKFFHLFFPSPHSSPLVCLVPNLNVYARTRRLEHRSLVCYFLCRLDLSDPVSIKTSSCEAAQLLPSCSSSPNTDCDNGTGSARTTASSVTAFGLVCHQDDLALVTSRPPREAASFTPCFFKRREDIYYAPLVATTMFRGLHWRCWAATETSESM